MSDIIINEFRGVHRESIYHNKPYVSPKPRSWYSAVYIYSGCLLYTVNGTVYRTKEGEIFLTAHGDLDVSEAESSAVSYIFCDFYTEAPINLNDNYLNRVNKPANPRAFAAQFANMLKVWNSRIFNYKMQCREILYSILNQLMSENYTQTESYFKYKHISAAIQKIETGFDSQLSVNELAGICGMSAGNLSRLFCDITGMTPSQYICRTRMNNAENLLRTGAYNISEIAVKCGYADVYSFSRAFKRFFGVPPTKY